MNLPNTFATYAVLGGKVRRISVDLDASGGIKAVSMLRESDASASGHFETQIPDKVRDTALAWAQRSLAWLKAEMGKATNEDFAIRDAVAKYRAACDALASLGRPYGEDRTQVERAAWGLSVPDADAVTETLWDAYRDDLCSRVAAEMERQANEAAKDGCTCGYVSILFPEGQHFASCPAAKWAGAHNDKVPHA